MAIVIGILCLIIASIGNKIYKYLLNPITSMFMLWGVILIMSTMGFIGLYGVSAKTLLIIVFGLTSYLMGIYIGYCPIRIVLGEKKNRNSYKECAEKAEINYKFLYVLYCISSFYYLYIGIQAVQLLLGGNSLAYIRSLATSAEINILRTNSTIVMFKNFIATPTVYLAIAILPIDIFYGKRDKILIVLTIMMASLWIVTTGGRSIILWTAIYLIAVFLTKSDVIKKSFLMISRRDFFKKFLIIIGVFILGFLLIYTTKLRKGDDVNFFRQFVVYFIAPLEHFEHYINIIDTQYKSYYGFGAASFYGFLYPFIYVIGHLIIGKSPKIFKTARYLSFTMLEQPTVIGDGINMNAFATMFYQPYIDGRILGVVIICLLFGVICGKVYYRAFNFGDKRMLLIYLLLLQKILFSMVRFYFTQPVQATSLIFAIIAIKYKTLKESNCQMTMIK